MKLFEKFKIYKWRELNIMTLLIGNHKTLKPIVSSYINRAADNRLRCALDLFMVLTKKAPYFSASHLQDHSLRMLSNSLVIKQKIDDHKLLALAIILHDVGVFHTQDKCHGPVSAEKIRPHLSDLRLTSAQQDKLCSIIRAHDEKLPSDNSTEAKALRTLDSIDAFGVMGVYRFLEIYTRRGLVSPKIFRDAYVSTVNRRHGIPLHWFAISEQRIINRAYETSYEALYQMDRAAHGSAMDKGEYLVLDGFKKIDWDLKRVPELLADQAFNQYDFVRTYFESLAQMIS